MTSPGPRKTTRRATKPSAPTRPRPATSNWARIWRC